MELIRDMWMLFIYILLNVIFPEGARTECGVDLCSWEMKQMFCNQSLILIHDVTDLRNEVTNERAFLNLRRMCSGFPQCDSTSYCTQHKRVRVAYFCINVHQIERQCPRRAQILSSAEGYIQSPGYPSAISLKRCLWTITVPADSYISIVLHDIQHDAPDYAACNGGLRFTTDSECPHGNFPSRDICQLREKTATYIACGNVEINFLPGDRGYKMRFWLSYKVYKISVMSTAAEFNNIPSMSERCPEGYFDYVSSGDMVIAQSPMQNLPQYNGTYNNQTGLKPVAEGNSIINAYSTEKMILYIAVTVAAISLTGLIIVTAICIRQRKLRPATQKTIQQAGSQNYILSHNGTTYNATLRRPLPPVHRSNGTTTQETPCLVDGYSVVADEIPYSRSEDTVRSPPYAEVEDNIVESGQTFRFGRLSVNKIKKSVENIYSELTDGKGDSNVYHEISDETFVHSPNISHNDQTHLISEKRSSKVLPIKQHKRPVSFEGPYASSDVTKNRQYPSDAKRKRHLSREVSGSLSYRSDSDGSLVIDNDTYEACQSAHV